MKSLKPSAVGVALSVAAALAVAGCDRTKNTARNDIGTDTQVTESKTDSVMDSVHGKAEDAERSVSDAAITTKVKAAILNDPALKVLQIHVDTVGGVVTLTGTVDATQNIDHAKRVVSSVDGVRSVNNKLEVRAG